MSLLAALRGRWEVQGTDMRYGPGHYIKLGRHYSEDFAKRRADYLQKNTGLRHRVIDRRMF